MHVWDGNTDVGARLRGEVERRQQQVVGTLAHRDQPSAAVEQLTWQGLTLRVTRYGGSNSRMTMNSVILSI